MEDFSAYPYSNADYQNIPLHWNQGISDNHAIEQALRLEIAGLIGNMKILDLETVLKFVKLTVLDARFTPR